MLDRLFKESRAWHLWGPFALWAGALWMGQNLPPDWSTKAGSYVLYFYGAVGWWCINWGIVLRKRNEYRQINGVSLPEPKPVNEPAPIQGEGWIPRQFIKVDGKPVAYQQVTTVPQICYERRMYVILWHWLESGKPIDLRTEYWVDHKGFFSQKQFEKDVMVRGDRNSIFYRVSSAKNATRGILNEGKVEEIARGGPLPL